jgi:hypothetical protein
MTERGTGVARRAGPDFRGGRNVPFLTGGSSNAYTADAEPVLPVTV